MAPESIIPPRTSKAVWTKYADWKLLDIMATQYKQGRKLDNGFKKEAWHAIMVKFNPSAIEEKKSVQQLKTHYYTKYPKVAEFRHHSLENYYSIDEIFCNTSATGSNAVTHSSSQLSIQGSLSEQITDNEEEGNDDYIEELESEGRLTPLPADGYEVGEDSLIEILEDDSMNRSRSVEISKEVSGFIVETWANKCKYQDSDNIHSINLLDDLPQPLIPPQYASPQDKFQQYWEALAVLMEMYKDGKFTESEVTEESFSKVG
ncbi:hypothetical protein L873DRAFT_1847391 [Choiromyces venosus 120613-1]|uniref:Myb/SANT-like domain-containing protein n=1 Tax=Choiromyces venosus 120613-1 TaxID=1336337 RepID=A0A3N4J466_9PEZI|nr:hypothetical protein L873DRAFT_1847391 [Choiromyces venosus 120613-1]